MRVLFTTLRTTSHFLPLVPFIEACLEHGHEVAVAAPAELAQRVAKTGAGFLPFGHPGDAGLAPSWARMHAAATPEEARNIVIREVFAGATVSGALPELQKTLASFRPDLVVRESQEYAAVLATEAAGIPLARVQIMLSRVEQELFAVAASVLDGHRSALGLSLDPSGARLGAAPALTLMPAGLEYEDASGGGAVRRFRSARKAAAALPKWWAAEHAASPLLYVTLGTVAGGMAPQHAVYRTVLDAVGALPARVLMTIGADLPLDVLGEVPANVHVERFVPQDDVLPHARAVLCHGGSGSVLGALAAGVPMVVTPMFADQPNNAERIATTGAGLALAAKTLSVTELRQALGRVLEEAPFRVAARRFADEIAALPLVAEAPAEIERIARAGVVS